MNTAHVPSGPPRMDHHGPQAFTLVELLVVITIVVILLALLTPALDRAIYQAELAVCGATLHSIGGGVITYAASFSRRYPYRRGVLQQPGNWEPQMLRNNLPPDEGGVNIFNDWVDDRPLYGGFLALDNFNCPLAGRVDYSKAANPDIDDVKIVTGYAMYWSWRWLSPGSGTMAKLGDRFSWSGPRAGLHGGPDVTVSFNLLANDYDMQWRVQNWADGSHPDADGLLVNDIRQNEDNGDMIDGRLWGPFTWARWQGIVPGGARGAVDRNFLYDDQSVRRLGDNRYDDDIQDRGLVRVPEFADDTVGDRDRSAFLPVN
jgi:prepilin-type N-terminal cleavage/methylation domain-containing protein